jgi:hypothetical protein
MPRLPIEELNKVTPRWPENKYGIWAPEDICGDWQCKCADKAREIMTDAEYELAFGMPKEARVPRDDYSDAYGNPRPGFTLRPYYD